MKQSKSNIPCSDRNRGSLFPRLLNRIDPRIFYALQGYVELKEWLEKEVGKTFNYNTLLFYCIRNFKSSVKVARKSHAKKDENAVNTFKKTLDESAKK